MTQPDVAFCFVCLGNICRSPLAEGIARAEIARRGLAINVASAGTGDWHVGNPPDRRMQATAKRHGVDIAGQRAAHVQRHDLQRFTLFLAMDRNNASDLRDLLGPSAPIRLLLDFHSGPESEVPDPYYGGPEGFERVYDLVHSGVRGLLDAFAAGQLR